MLSPVAYNLLQLGSLGSEPLWAFKYSAAIISEPPLSLLSLCCSCAAWPMRTLLKQSKGACQENSH